MVYTRCGVSYLDTKLVHVCLNLMTNISAKLDRPEQRQIRGFNTLLPSRLTVRVDTALCTVLGADSARMTRRHGGCPAGLESTRPGSEMEGTKSDERVLCTESLRSRRRASTGFITRQYVPRGCPARLISKHSVAEMSWQILLHPHAALCQYM